MNEREQVKELKAYLQGTEQLSASRLQQLLQRLESPLQQNKAGKMVRNWTGGEAHGKVAIVGNHTTDGFEYALAYDAVKRKLSVEVMTTGFNQWAIQLLQPGSELDEFNGDVTVCSLDESVIYQYVTEDEWSVEGLNKGLDRAFQDIEEAVTSFAHRTTGTIVLHTIPLPVHDLKSFIGYREKQLVSSSWRQWNSRLLDLHKTLPNVITLDMDVLTQLVSPLRDERIRHYGSMSYCLDVWHCLSPEVMSIVAAQKGRGKKVLALDLDDTLWGGVIGDDGIHGIQLSNTFPGNQYQAFQRVIKRLHRQGVLLTIASKNDWNNVKDVFTKNEQMLLEESSFTQIFCHWNPKADSLRKMAATLNLGIDSFVFADDNPFERQLMNEELQEVTVLPMSNDPSQYVMNLLEDGWFHTFSLTDEDRKRSEKYKQLVQHEELKEGATSLEDYLQQLHMVLHWTPLKEEQIQRVTQLSQRTNQFNLTTERLTEADVARTVEQSIPESIYTFRLEDRFGDNGLIGYLHIDEASNEWRIRNMVMSCRVFKRHVEAEALHLLVEEARRKGIQRIRGSFKRTAKNGLVQSFYGEHGFNHEQGEEWSYSCEKPLPKIPWIEQRLKDERVNV